METEEDRDVIDRIKRSTKAVQIFADFIAQWYPAWIQVERIRPTKADAEEYADVCDVVTLEVAAVNGFLSDHE